MFYCPYSFSTFSVLSRGFNVVESRRSQIFPFTLSYAKQGIVFVIVKKSVFQFRLWVVSEKLKDINPINFIFRKICPGSCTYCRQYIDCGYQLVHPSICGDSVRPRYYTWNSIASFKYIKLTTSKWPRGSRMISIN